MWSTEIYFKNKHEGVEYSWFINYKLVFGLTEKAKEEKNYRTSSHVDRLEFNKFSISKRKCKPVCVEAVFLIIASSIIMWIILKLSKIKPTSILTYDLHLDK